MAADSAKPTPFDRFEDALRKVLSVPKKEVEKDLARQKKEREAKRSDRPK
jgi:hypothetical protein